ncbi:MAG: putative rane protein [Parcubacteria group bacterium]|nr:putative rane protein [Parcubacteria group bacterium]
MISYLRSVKAALTPNHIAVVAFSVLYAVTAGVVFYMRGNTEFLGYVAVIVMVLLVGGCVLAKECVPIWLIWMLAIVGLLHMLGALVYVNGDVLYNYVPFPIENPTGLTIIKMDQIIHTYGTATAALLVFFFLQRAPGHSRTTLIIVTILAACGVGALNEIIEFTAKLTVPNTDVGGYYNTSMDLVINLLGSIIGAFVGLGIWKRPA